MNDTPEKASSENEAWDESGSHVLRNAEVLRATKAEIRREKAYFKKHGIRYPGETASETEGEQTHGQSPLAAAICEYKIARRVAEIAMHDYRQATARYARELRKAQSERTRAASIDRTGGSGHRQDSGTGEPETPEELRT